MESRPSSQRTPDPERAPDTAPTTLGPDPGPGAGARSAHLAEVLRKETVGGFLLVAAAVVALVWANSPWADGYFGLRDAEVGYAPWHLRLSLGAWAADGLLAIFFFMVGLELKRELIVGDLRRWDRAVVPVAAAAGGVVVPALVYAAVNLGQGEALRGWAIPTATDIAFAVAVLAVVAPNLPSAVRIFLLTLAVVDDLIAIVIIAVVYSSGIDVTMLAWALVPLAAYVLLARQGRRIFRRSWASAWVLLLPIGAVMWALVHASGVHATIAGVVLGFAVPVRLRARHGEDEGMTPLAEVFEHRLRPVSAGFAVPVFAFFSAGVAIGGWDGLSSSLTSTVTIGIVLGLVVGKVVGILGATYAVTRMTRSSLDPSVRWADLLGVSVIAGIGFTVSLLVAELSFGVGTELGDDAKTGIILASLVAAVLGAALLTVRDRRHRAGADT